MTNRLSLKKQESSRQRGRRTPSPRAGQESPGRGFRLAISFA